MASSRVRVPPTARRTVPTVADEARVHRCPRCNGVGRTARPPWVPGDVDTWVATSTQDYECSLCHGKGLVTVGRNQFELLTADAPIAKDPWAGAGPAMKASGTGDVWDAIHQARAVLDASSRWSTDA